MKESIAMTGEINLVYFFCYLEVKKAEVEQRK